MSGYTHSTDLPTTAGSPQAAAPGGDCGFFRDWLEFAPCSDGFLSRIGPQPPPAAPGQSPTPDPGPTDPGVTQPGETGPAAGGVAPAGDERPASPGGDDAAETLRQERRIRAGRTGWGVRGRVVSAAGACRRRVPVVLERRASGSWRTVARGRSGAAGRFGLERRLRSGAHRVRLPALTRALADGRSVRCAVAVRRLPG